MRETLHLVHLLPSLSCSSEEKLNIIRNRDRIFYLFSSIVCWMEGIAGNGREAVKTLSFAG